MAGRQKCWKINTAAIEVPEKILHNGQLCGNMSPASVMGGWRTAVCRKTDDQTNPHETGPARRMGLTPE